MTKELPDDQAAPALVPPMWPAASGWTVIAWASADHPAWYHLDAPILAWKLAEAGGDTFVPVAPSCPPEALAAGRYVVIPPSKGLGDPVVDRRGTWCPSVFTMLSALRLNWERDTGLVADQPPPAPRPPKPSGFKPLNPKRPRRLGS